LLPTYLLLWERYTEPVQRGGRYFYTRNDGLQNQSVLYVAESLDGTPRELLDPNRLSEDGTVALAGWEVSDDGRLLAYGLAAAGSDWREWHVRDVASGQDQGDHLKWIKFSSVAWTPDNQGFFYSRYDEPPPGEKFTGANYFQKLFYHRLGDPQDQDRLIYERPDQKEWGFSSRVTDDGQYLVIGVWRGTEPKNQVFYKPLADPQAEVVELLSGFDAEYEFLGNQGSLFWLLTDLDAPLRRVIAIDVERPERPNWKEVIAESEQVIRGAGIVGDRFFVSYLKDATTRIEMFELDGRRLGEVALPGIGTAGGFGGRQSDRETFYWFTSFTAPVTIFRYEVATGKSSVFRRPQLPFDPADYETRQVFFESRDGTRVPMFLTHRRGARPAGGWQTILYGYGGFDISLTPSFSVSNLVWMERGGLYAVPNLRGGGEYGRRWHEAGMKANKQNVFDDFLAAAQWLIDHGYTTSNRLAIRGGSNGGLLVGAAMTQRPELFGAAIPAVGVMDMLRYHIMDRYVVFLSIPGLRGQDLVRLPRLTARMAGGGRTSLTASFPCVTWPVQANMLTGRTAGRARRGGQWLLLARPAAGRDVDGLERQDHRPQIWDRLHQQDPSITSAVWFPMLSKGCGADYVCMPAPIHNPDGSEDLWCYTKPVELYGQLRDRLGHFPLKHFWGPLASIASSAWIVESAIVAAERFRPNFFYLYLPHLDYAAQKTGPDSEAAMQALDELDRCLGQLIDGFRGVWPFRADLDRGLGIRDRAGGPRDVSEPRAPQCGAVAGAASGGRRASGPGGQQGVGLVDHQFSHVFVRDADAEVIARVAALFRGMRGSTRCWSVRIEPNTDWIIRAAAK
jgi:prolyl oligopeptidase